MPTTQELRDRLYNSLKETQETWAAEGFVGDSLEQTALMNAKALGGLSVLRQIIDLLEEGW